WGWPNSEVVVATKPTYCVCCESAATRMEGSKARQGRLWLSVTRPPGPSARKIASINARSADLAMAAKWSMSVDRVAASGRVFQAASWRPEASTLTPSRIGFADMVGSNLDTVVSDLDVGLDDAVRGQPIGGPLELGDKVIVIRLVKLVFAGVADQ